jgi:lipoprotein-releasing system permease protein
MGKSSTPTKSSFFLSFLLVFRDPWARWMGVRYLGSQKRSQFLSFVSWISVLGVGLGVAAMIVVLSVMDGFESELKRRLMSTELHVLISPRAGAPSVVGGRVPESALGEGNLERLASMSLVASVDSTLTTEVMIRARQKVSGVMLTGVSASRLERLDPQVEERVSPEDPRWKDDPQGGIYIGQELALMMGLLAGDSLRLISPTEMEGPLSSIPRTKDYWIAGIYRSGLTEQEMNVAYASRQGVESFVKQRGVISQVEVAVRDFDRAPEVKAKIAALLPDFKVQDWTDLNSHLFFSLKLERIAMFIVLAFIVVVASFNIVTTLTLMVTEKRKEISILKAMGARNEQLGAVFLAEGLLLGSLGVLGGLVTGGGLCILLKRYEIVRLPEVYLDRTLPVTFDPAVYWVTALVALVIVLIAAYYPTQRASRLMPIDGIRNG